MFTPLCACILKTLNSLIIPICLAKNSSGTKILLKWLTDLPYVVFPQKVKQIKYYIGMQIKSCHLTLLPRLSDLL